MKRSLLIWGTALILVIAAFYVTSNYDKTKATAPNTSNSSKEIQEPNSSADKDNLSKNSSDASLGKAIDFKLKDLDGKEVALSDFKGKNVFVNFFATWCPPCRAEMPDIEKLYHKYKDQDLVILAVDLGEDRNTVKNFIDKNKFTFKVLLDSDQSVAVKYSITAIPVSIFIDKEGNVAAKKIGAMSVEEMEYYIKRLVDKK